jgi:hypothetical protein
VQVEAVGQAVGHDAERVARHHVHVGGGRIGEEARAVIDRGGADIDAGMAAGQGRGADAGMGQGIVGDFEQMALLRIDLFGLARAHAEGRGIEAPDIVDQAGGEGVGAAGLVGGGMVVGPGGEAIRGDPADRRAVVAQQAPEAFGVVGTGQTAGIADDRDFVMHLHRRSCPPTERQSPPLHHRSALANDLMINLSTQPVQFSRGLAFTILNVAKSCNCCTAQ